MPGSITSEMTMHFALRPFSSLHRVRCGRLEQVKTGITKGNMKNISKLMVAALALGASAWIATAQTTDTAPPDGAPPGGPGMRPHHPPPPFMQALDANTNRIIDADEIANAATALKALDKNGDGQLTPDELFGPPPGAGQAGGGQRPPPPQGFGGGTNHPPVPPIIASLDANHDGVIDADELANAPAALKTLDKNGDGKLTPDEFLPPWRRGPHGPGGPGMGGPGGPPPGDEPPPPQDAPQQQ